MCCTRCAIFPIAAVPVPVSRTARHRALLPHAFIEALDKRILIRLAGLDVARRDSLPLSPADELRRSEFRAVVHSYGCGLSVEVDQLVQHAQQTARRNRTPTRNAQGFPIAFVDHIQQPEFVAVIERVMHEVQCPYLIDRLRRNQGLSLTGDDPLLRSGRQVQLHAAIHTLHTLVIPDIALVAKALEAFPETPAAMPRDRVVECRHHRRISPHSIDRLSIQRRQRQACNPAGPSFRHLMFLHQHING